ncbi:hypothetical protein B0H13DRAFT_2118428 [Mycena leptocephala]|nr:hypothetical protein B0H13DRAFT_2118428 [Mycena leptocephala]
MPGKRTSLQTRHVTFSPSESPFFAIFEKDRVPSTQEKRMIQELLAEKTTQLAHLNSKVPKRDWQETELDHTRRFVKFHQALISPWKRLPVEIMSEIFLFSLEVNQDEDNYWIDDRQGTLLLCKICSTWRAIAIRTPALWNILSLSLHSVRHPPDWISTWLDRSRSFPVYLQVFWGHKSLPDVINSVISIFASHLHHTAGLWVDGLDIEDSALIEQVPRPTFPPDQPSYAPLLATLGVDLPPDSRWDWVHAACRASPRLTNLTTSRCSVDWFPIASLTKLHLIDSVPMSKMFEILEHASGLQNLSLDVAGPSVTSSTGNVLVNKSVSRMEITSNEYLGQFLDQTEFPGLVHLAIHQIFHWPEAEFRSFLSRSSCVLNALDFYDVHISQEQIIACLQYKACITLESLVVWECEPEAHALLQYLTYHGHPFPNPHLKSIELGYMVAPDGLLSSLVESRLFTTTIALPSSVPTPARLSKVRFSFMEGPVLGETLLHTEDWKRLRELETRVPDSELEIFWPEEEEE